MADKFVVFQICPQCKGRKVVDITQTTPEPDDPEPDVTTVTCPQCNGEGEVEWGRMEEIDTT
jgi:ssDNA-binding Zn-finger/Zn-ribbon topoisomerase 1